MSDQHDLRMLQLQQRRVKVFERQGRARPWHMWGTTAYATMVLGICILIAGAWISTSLNAYCPEDTGVVLRQS